METMVTFLLRQDKKRERQSQAAQNVGSSSKVAITSLSTAVRAVRAGAAAGKLREEETRRDSRSLQATVDVHEDVGLREDSVTNDTAKVFARAAAAERMRQFTSQTAVAPPPPPEIPSSPARLLPGTTAPPEPNRDGVAPPTTTPTASGLTYSSLWPSSKDVVGVVPDSPSHSSIPNLVCDDGSHH